MTQLSYATSVQNHESKAIFEERLYQLQNALRIMNTGKSQEQPNHQVCNEFENILKQVKAIKCNTPAAIADNCENQSVMSQSNQELKSLKIWARVII